MREPGPLTGAIDLLTPQQKRKQRALRVMGLDLAVKPAKPLPPTFPMSCRGSAAYQLQRARAARMFGWIDDATFAQVEVQALPLMAGTPVATTVDDVALRANPPRLQPHPHEQKGKPKGR